MRVFCVLEFAVSFKSNHIWLSLRRQNQGILFEELFIQLKKYTNMTCTLYGCHGCHVNSTSYVVSLIFGFNMVAVFCSYIVVKGLPVEDRLPRLRFLPIHHFTLSSGSLHIYCMH